MSDDYSPGEIIEMDARTIRELRAALRTLEAEKAQAEQRADEMAKAHAASFGALATLAASLEDGEVDDYDELVSRVIVRTINAESALASAQQQIADLTTWRPIETHDGSSKPVLVRVALDNGSDPKMMTVRAFFAKAGTVDMDSDDEEIVNEDGMNTEDAWFEESACREPYAWMLSYWPTHWLPLPPAPATDAPR